MKYSAPLLKYLVIMFYHHYLPSSPPHTPLATITYPPSPPPHTLTTLTYPYHHHISPPLSTTTEPSLPLPTPTQHIPSHHSDIPTSLVPSTTTSPNHHNHNHLPISVFTTTRYPSPSPQPQHIP